MDLAEVVERVLRCTIKAVSLEQTVRLLPRHSQKQFAVVSPAPFSQVLSGNTLHCHPGWPFSAQKATRGSEHLHWHVEAHCHQGTYAAALWGWPWFNYWFLLQQGPWGFVWGSVGSGKLLPLFLLFWIWAAKAVLSRHSSAALTWLKKWVCSVTGRWGFSGTGIISQPCSKCRKTVKEISERLWL